MDRNTLLLIAGRIVVFLVAVFLVLTLTYLMFFVVGDEARLRPLDPDVRTEAILDDLKIGEPRGDQYINFMVKMISGEFFLSAGVRPLESTSDFIYHDVFATAVRLIVVTAFVIVAGFGYAWLAERRLGGAPGRIMRVVALVLAVFPVVVLYFAFTLAVNEWSDLAVESVLELALFLSCMISIAAAAVLVFERVVRPMSSDRSVNFMRRTLRAMATSRTAAVMSFFLALVMTSVLAIESLARYDGIGAVMFRSIMYDPPVFMACAFIVSSIMLIMFLVLDITIILASGPHSVRHLPEKAETSRRRAGFRTHINLLTIRRVWAAYRKSRTGMCAMAAFILLIVISLLAPLLATVKDPYDPSSLMGDILAEPSLSPSPDSGVIHPLGTNSLGRDIYSMLLYDSADSISIVIIVAALALVVGMSSTFVGGYARRLDITMVRSISWVVWILADVFIALIFLLSSIAGVLTGSSIALFIVMFIAWISAPFAKAEATRTLLAEIASEIREGAATMPLPGVIARSLHITKFVVLFGFLSAVMVEMLLPHGNFMFSIRDLIDVGWASVITDAYNEGGLISGWWWMFIPQAVMIGLLGGLSYMILDKLEHVFERWPESGGHAHSAPITASPPVVSSSDN
ncbi:MAG: hypothetical protein OEM29_00455 [Thermoplasmata archaeon]|nr:hypothetical protein [Thermoplasmata archaeon]